MLVLLDTIIGNNFTTSRPSLDSHQISIMHAGVVSWVEETAIEFTTDRTGADVTFGGFMVAFHASSFIPHVSLSFFLSSFSAQLGCFLWRSYLLI
jgi:hypothetical protein